MFKVVKTATDQVVADILPKDATGFQGCTLYGCGIHYYKEDGTSGATKDNIPVQVITSIGKIRIQIGQQTYTANKHSFALKRSVADGGSTVTQTTPNYVFRDPDNGIDFLGNTTHLAYYPVGGPYTGDDNAVNPSSPNVNYDTTTTTTTTTTTERLYPACNVSQLAVIKIVRVQDSLHFDFADKTDVISSHAPTTNASGFHLWANYPRDALFPGSEFEIKLYSTTSSPIAWGMRWDFNWDDALNLTSIVENNDNSPWSYFSFNRSHIEQSSIDGRWRTLPFEQQRYIASYVGSSPTGGANHTELLMTLNFRVNDDAERGVYKIDSRFFGGAIKDINDDVLTELGDPNDKIYINDRFGIQHKNVFNSENSYAEASSGEVFVATKCTMDAHVDILDENGNVLDTVYTGHVNVEGSPFRGKYKKPFGASQQGTYKSANKTFFVFRSTSDANDKGPVYNFRDVSAGLDFNGSTTHVGYYPRNGPFTGNSTINPSNPNVDYVTSTTTTTTTITTTTTTTTTTTATTTTATTTTVTAAWFHATPLLFFVSGPPDHWTESVFCLDMSFLCKCQPEQQKQQRKEKQD